MIESSENWGIREGPYSLHFSIQLSQIFLGPDFTAETYIRLKKSSGQTNRFAYNPCLISQTDNLKFRSELGYIFGSGKF